MLQARFNLITADPDRMADTVGYIKSEIRPAVESLHGSMGMSLYANTEVGVAVLESFWASRAALIASEQITAPRRKEHGPACHGHRMRRAIPGSRFRTGGAAGYRGGAAG